MDRVKGFRTGRRAPRWSSVPHSHLPSSGFAHAYGRQWHRQHVLTSGGSADPGERLHLHLRTCSTPIRGWVLGSAGCGSQSPISSSSLQLSLGPGASCFRRPLCPAKCPRGTLYVHTWDVGRVPMHSNLRLLLLSSPFPWRPRVLLLEEQPRGRSSTQSLGRAVVRGCRGGSSDNQHRGRGSWLSKMGREESLVEAGC